MGLLRVLLFLSLLRYLGGSSGFQLTRERPGENPSYMNTAFTFPKPIYISTHIQSQHTSPDQRSVDENVPFLGQETEAQGELWLAQR